MKKSKKWAIAFWAIFFADPFLRALVLGVALQSVAATGGGAAFLSSIFGIGLLVLNIFFIYNWFASDAQENGIHPSGGLKACVVLLAFIGIPYYLYKYKGFKEGSKTLSIIILLFVCRIGFHTLVGKLL